MQVPRHYYVQCDTRNSFAIIVMARICACCFLLGSGFAAASVQKPGECSSTLRYSWTRRSYQSDHRRHCGGRQSVQHHSPQRQDDIDKARFTSPAMSNRETVKYFVVEGDYGYSHNLRVDTSKGGREWRLRRCACSPCRAAPNNHP